MSTGFARLASAGSSSASCAVVSGESSESSRPGRLAGVRAEDPEPARVRQDRDPPATGQRLGREQRRRVDQLLERPRAEHAGLVEERVDGLARSPASAAVCEPAARAPAVDVPLFMARIGFLRATRLAIRPKRRGLPNDSR